MSSDPELPQERGERSGEMVKVGGPRTAIDYHLRLVENLKTMPSSRISDKERAERLEAAEWRTAYLRGDSGVSEVDAERAQMRVSVRWLLLSKAPAKEFPQTRPAIAFAQMKYATRIMHSQPDASDTHLWEIGRTQYFRWYQPIAQNFFDIYRGFVALHRIGNREDTGAQRALLERGNSLYKWLRVRYETNAHRPPSARDIPYLPGFSFEPLTIDRAWWGKTTASQAKDVVVWWAREEAMMRPTVGRHDPGEEPQGAFL